MTALALYDGSPSSVRALELACVPSLLLNHATEQLGVLWAFRDQKDPAQLTAPTQIVDSIGKNRFAAATLNYKLEMLRLPADVMAAPLAPVAPTTVPTTPPTGAGKGTPAKEAAKKDAKGGAPAAPTAPTPTLPDPAAPTDPAVVASADGVIGAKVAAYLGDYTVKRSKHFHSKYIILGVGNTQQGKNIVVGNVAKNIVSHFRSVLPLFLMKASGSAVRPQAPMRILVLVVPGVTGTAHLEAVLRIAKISTRQDRVGVVLIGNNGTAKLAENFLQVEATEDGEPSSLRATEKRCLEILAGAGLRDGPDPAADAGGAEGAAATATNAPAAETGAAVAAAPGAAGQEAFPLINTMFLEPTRAVPLPSVDDVPLQLVKFVSGMKTDFLALPPLCGHAIGDALVQACLSAPKPHVLLL